MPNIRLFIVDGNDILSTEGAIQEDPISMSIYALAILLHKEVLEQEI